MKRWILIIEFYTGGGLDEVMPDIISFLKLNGFNAILTNKDITILEGGTSSDETYRVCQHLNETFKLTIQRIIPIYGYINTSIK